MNHSQAIHPERKCRKGGPGTGCFPPFWSRSRSCPVPQAGTSGAAPPPTKMLLLSVPPPGDLLPGCGISVHLCKDVMKLSGPGVCLGCAYRLWCWTQRGDTGLCCWGTAAHVHGDVPQPCVCGVHGAAFVARLVFESDLCCLKTWRSGPWISVQMIYSEMMRIKWELKSLGQLQNSVLPLCEILSDLRSGVQHSLSA